MYDCRKSLWGILPTETTGQNSQKEYKNTSIHLCLVVYQLVSVSELLSYMHMQHYRDCINFACVYCSVITLVTAFLSTKVSGIQTDQPTQNTT